MPENDVFALLSEQYAAIMADNQDLRESLDSALLSLQIEDGNWLKLGAMASDNSEGFDLDELKDTSKTIRKHVALSGLIKRGADLHSGYVFAKGINIDGTDGPRGRGKPSALRQFFDKPVNQESIFSDTAHVELQKCRYSDGMVLALCDTSKREVRIIPLNEITGVKVNPDFPSEVWAYQRTWNPNPAPGSQPRVRWIYTARYTGAKQASYTSNGQQVPVLPNAVIVDAKFNSQVGWVLGVPDAAAALPHYQGYVEFMQHGKVVTESLAKILFKITNKSAAGAKNAAAKVANFNGTGGAASMSDGQDVAAVSTAGKGYSFESGDRLAGMMALALNVPLIELLSNSATAGSSYAAAQALSPSTIASMRIMQQQWIDFYRAIFSVFKLDVTEISFPPIQDADPYREGQLLSLAWLTGLVHEDEMRPEILNLLKIPSRNDKAPEGVMLPNNINSAARTDVDPNGATYTGPDANGPKKMAPSPDQGRSNGIPTDSGQRNDLRSDVLSNALAAVQLDEMRELVERFEAAVSQSKV